MAMLKYLSVRRNAIASGVTRRANQQRMKKQPVTVYGESRSPQVASSD
jgi:hypothetical protein